MSRSAKRSDRFDPERLVTAAVEAFLGNQSGAQSGARREQAGEKHVWGRAGGALALGVVIGIGARALYRRARDFDLERAARAVEQRIVS